MPGGGGGDRRPVAGAAGPMPDERPRSAATEPNCARVSTRRAAVITVAQSRGGCGLGSPPGKTARFLSPCSRPQCAQRPSFPSMYAAPRAPFAFRVPDSRYTVLPCSFRFAHPSPAGAKRRPWSVSLRSRWDWCGRNGGCIHTALLNRANVYMAVDFKVENLRENNHKFWY